MTENPALNPEVVEARLRRLENGFTMLEEALHEGQLAAEAPSSASSHFETFYGSLQEWVEQHFVHMFARPVGNDLRWCSQWWDHAEAYGRLDALWRAWEVTRERPESLPGWWLMLDHHLPRLTDPRGTFGECKPDRHTPPTALLCAPMPAGWGPAPGDD